jgi:hypothetical protein
MPPAIAHPADRQAIGSSEGYKLEPITFYRALPWGKVGPVVMGNFGWRHSFPLPPSRPRNTMPRPVAHKCFGSGDARAYFMSWAKNLASSKKARPLARCDWSRSLHGLRPVALFGVPSGPTWAHVAGDVTGTERDVRQSTNVAHNLGHFANWAGAAHLPYTGRSIQTDGSTDRLEPEPC